MPLKEHADAVHGLLTLLRPGMHFVVHIIKAKQSKDLSERLKCTGFSATGDFLLFYQVMQPLQPSMLQPAGLEIIPVSAAAHMELGPPPHPSNPIDHPSSHAPPKPEVSLALFTQQTFFIQLFYNRHLARPQSHGRRPAKLHAQL